MLPDASLTQVIRIEPIEGRPCRGLEASPRQPGGMKLVPWFDAETWLLRRSEEILEFDAATRAWSERHLLTHLAEPGLTERDRGILERSLELERSTTRPDSRVETTTTWRPQVDIAIAHEECTFVLPPWAPIGPPTT